MKFASESSSDAEFSQTTRELQARIRSLERKLQMARDEIEELRDKCRTDWLTGIANRRQFDQDLNSRLAEFERHGYSFCLAVIDIDSFKALNDQYGHGYGDRWLTKFAQTLSQNLRSCDRLYRIGGDEFAFILPGTDGEQAKAVFRRVFDAVLPAINREFAGDDISLSVGWAVPAVGQTKDELLEAADQAMYADKRSSAR